jgi:hypothetical protein
MSSQAKPERGKSKTPTWKTETGIAIHQASGRRQDNRTKFKRPARCGEYGIHSQPLAVTKQR